MRGHHLAHQLTDPVGPALRDVASLGPFFVLPVAEREPGTGRRPRGVLSTHVEVAWRPVLALHDPDVLRERVATGRAGLARAVAVDSGTVEERVAVSLVVQSICARLLSPVVATAVLHGIVPRFDAADLQWRPAATGPLPMRLVGPLREPAQAATVQQCSQGVDAVVIGPLVAPLLDAARSIARLAPALLWSNVASALVGAAAVVTAARPESAGRVREVTDLLLALPPLAGRGSFEPATRRFRRSACCLYYRLPGGGLCGDCPLPRGLRAGLRC